MAHTMQSIAKDHFKLGSFSFKKDHFPKKPMVSTHISEVQLNFSNILLVNIPKTRKQGGRE